MFSLESYKQYKKQKHIIDFIIAIIGCLCVVLITPIIWIINLFFNVGPLLYVQNRVGLNGAIFKMYKFRTMIEEAEQGWSRLGQ